MLTSDPDSGLSMRERLALAFASVKTNTGKIYDALSGVMRIVKIVIVPAALTIGVIGVIRAVTTHRPLSKPIGLLCTLAIILSLIFDYAGWEKSWSSVRRFARALLPCSFAFLSVVAVDGVLLGNYQGQELLRRLAEEAPQREIWFFFILSGLWFLEIWYVCRVMLLFDFERGAGDHGTPRIDFLRTRKVVPRLASAIAAAALAFAMFKASRAYPNRLDSYIVRTRMHSFTVCLLLIGALILLGVVFRRHLPLIEREPWTKRIRSLPHMPLFTRVLLVVIVAASSLVIIAIDAKPLPVSWSMGPLGVVIAAAICWVAIASAGLYFAMRHRVPVFGVAFASLIAFSYFNDNHSIQLHKDLRPRPDRKRLEAAFSEWTTMHVQQPALAPAAVPLFIVAAEGGGIRAAYWTASVLAHLQRRRPTFAEHTFAISGVSGGSLGAVAFAAAAGDAKGRNNTVDKTRRMLSQDYLAPLLGRLLFSDLTQQFMPVPIVRDRARAIEEAWENGWSSNAIANGEPDPLIAQKQTFASPFTDLWAHASSPIPNLFLNGTIVETGQRVIVSNLMLPESLENVNDGLKMLGREPSLSTAIHMSARFTYVSPAGLIKRPDLPRGQWRHVVDGGYFDNSGCTTASDILSLLEPEIKGGDLKRRIVPVLIIINHQLTDTEADGPSETLLAEFFCPIRTMLKARAAHAVTATAEASERVRAMNGAVITFCLPQLPVPAPLGWSLSSRVAHEIDDCFTINSRARCAANTKVSLQQFDSFLPAGGP